jgi:hypothetical protein
MEGSASASASTILEDLWSRIDAYLRSRLRHDPYAR